MIGIDDFTHALAEEHREFVFKYGGETYMISESMGSGPNGETLRYAGPGIGGYAQNAEAVLDAVILNGETLRARLPEIAPL